MPVCSRIGRKAPNKGSSTFPLTSLAAFFVSPPPSPSRLARVGCPSPLPLHCSPGLLLPAAAPTAHRLHHLLPRCPLPHCNAPCLVEPVDRRPPHISASANKNSIPVQHQHARIITHCSGMPAPTNKSIESVCLSPPPPLADATPSWWQLSQGRLRFWRHRRSRAWNRTGALPASARRQVHRSFSCTSRCAVCAGLPTQSCLPCLVPPFSRPRPGLAPCCPSLFSILDNRRPDRRRGLTPSPTHTSATTILDWPCCGSALPLLAWSLG